MTINATFYLRLLGLSLFFLFRVSLSTGQNLVPNHSFEDLHWNPIWQEGFHTGVIDWDAYLTVDIHYDDNGAAGVDNLHLGYGYQNPYDGTAMAGIRAFDFREWEWHEIIYTQLLDTLIAGELYYVSFWVSPSEAPKYITDDIGLYFSQEERPSSRVELLGVQPHIENPEGNYIDDVTAWYEVSGYYKAKGGEINLFIGNFKPDSETTYKESGGPGESAAYFFIDHVVVEKCPTPICIDLRDTTLCGREVLEVNVSTPNAEYLWNDGSTFPNRVFNQAGQYQVEVSTGGCTIIDSMEINIIPATELGNDSFLCAGERLQLEATLAGSVVTWNNHSVDSTLEVKESGVYSVQVENDICVFNDTIQVNYFEDSINLYPNPSDGNFIINTNLEPIDQIKLYDVSGRLLFESTDEMSILPITLKSYLADGTYLVKISSGGCSITEKIVIAEKN